MAHGGRLLVNQLEAFGVRRIFSVPGESFLPVLDALHDSPIENIVCRHEGGAGMMAEASGKMTGLPGIAFVTRGPGATNAAAALHVARQDSTPMILFVGQVPRGHRGREAFQELDYPAVFGSIAKWVAEADDARRLPELMERAWRTAIAGRAGPVVLSLPEDMLSAPASAPLRPRPSVPVEGVSEAQIRAIGDALAEARRPLAVVGGGRWSDQAARDLERFAARFDLPVAASFRRQHYMDNRSPQYVGDLGFSTAPKLAERLRQADLLLLLGTRFSEVPSGGYESVAPDAPGRCVIHVHPDPETPGTWLRTDLAITAQAPDILAALADLAPRATPPWQPWRAAARAEYEAWQRPAETPGALKLEQVIHWLSRNLPEDAILTNGAGNFAAFIHRHFRFRRYGTQLAPTSGSMGYGLPAAIAAALEHPERLVVCVAGDGDLQMTMNELSTAVQHGARPIVIVANNGQYGTIRLHQERRFPGRVSGTALANPDFAAIAQAYGGHGETIARTEDFPAAFARARDAGSLALIELRLDPDAIAPGLSLSALRARAQADSGG